MKDFIMVALAQTNEEANKLIYIYKIASEGFRFGQLGKDAFNRMKNGDFSNTPKKQKKA